MRGSVLITGGHGNLGSYITKHLVSLGYEVYVLTKKRRNIIKNISYKIIEADITNLDELNKRLKFNIDFCIHTASFNEFFLPDYPKRALEINTLGTRNVLEVLSQKNIKNFIYFSTFHVYGESSGVITEDTSLNPKNDYASTHLFAEYYIKQFGFTNNLNYTILRLTNSYGVPIMKDTNKWYLVLNDLSKLAFEKEKIILSSNGEAQRDFIYMGDVAIIIDKLLKIEARNDIYNLSSGTSYKIIDIANRVKREYDLKYSKNIDISVDKNDKNEYKSISIKNDKLKSIIDFSIRDMVGGEVNKIFNLLEEKI